MKRALWVVLLVLAVAPKATGQSVGVVLSGGGAKGLYHVGILKALEENGIPIDYVSGASMGAIVGGMYAAGYSPDEMLQFFITDSTQQWINQTSASLQNSYYFKKFDPTPAMLTMRLDPRRERSEPALQLPTNLVAPYRLDFAFLRMLYPASAAAGGDFDRLMVPFRCNASDVYNKRSVVFESGNLAEACRASMAIPLVFQPIEQDSILLFDGGLYNNFPWQPLDSAFHPDVLIGGICASNYESPAKDNIVQQVTVMATGKTDYTLRDSGDLIIRRKFEQVSTLDYNRATYIMARGYEDAMQQMPRIKARIGQRRVPPEEMAARRAEFRARIQPLVFDSLTIEGLTEKQTQYVFIQLGISRTQPQFDIRYFERKYMQVLAGGTFRGDFPQMSFNPRTGRYGMHLRLRTRPSMYFSLGGNISSTALNQGYASLMYQSVGRNVSTFGLQGYFGTFYSAVQAMGRHDLYTHFPFYVGYNYTFEHYNYGANHMRHYYRTHDWRYTRRQENFLEVAIGIPVLENAAFRGKVQIGVSSYDYFRSTYSNLDRPDRSDFTHASISAEVQERNLNYTLFPTRGRNQRLLFKYTTGLERYRPGTLRGASPTFRRQHRDWWEAHFLHENYRPLTSWFTFGYLLDAAVSNHPALDNPLVTAISQPAFEPIPLMRVMFMPEYRSASYVGLGAMPIFNVLPNFTIRTYAYGFVPQEVVFDHGWQPDVWNRLRTRSEFVFGGAFVYQSPIGPASLSLNKYTTGTSAWQLVFNFGYTLFASRKY